jgi:hypothetical protein
MLAALLLTQSLGFSVNTISHVETLSTKGKIVLSNANPSTSWTNVPTAGGVTIGYFSSTVPTDLTIASWVATTAVANLVANNWVDIRTIIATGASMQATGDWDWPGSGSPGTAGTAIGGTYNWVYNATVASNQLYIFGFNDGSSDFGYSGSTTVAASSTAFTSSSFANSTQWAALKATNWILPAGDNTALELKIVDVDLASEILVGVDLGNNVAMIPEPSVASLLVLGVSLFFRNRKGVAKK